MKATNYLIIIGILISAGCRSKSSETTQTTETTNTTVQVPDTSASNMNNNTNTSANLPQDPPPTVMGKKAPTIAKRELETKQESKVQEISIDAKTNNKKRILLAQMFYRDPVIEVPNSEKSTQVDYFYSADYYWKGNNVTKAYLALEKVEKTDPRYTYAQLLLGQASFKLRRFIPAENYFKSVIKTNKKPYTQEAEWNLSLTYLAIGKGKELETLMTKIINDTKHLHNIDAVNLYSELKQGYVK